MSKKRTKIPTPLEIPDAKYFARPITLPCLTRVIIPAGREYTDAILYEQDPRSNELYSLFTPWPELLPSEILSKIWELNRRYPSSLKECDECHTTKKLTDFRFWTIKSSDLYGTCSQCKNLKPKKTPKIAQYVSSLKATEGCRDCGVVDARLTYYVHRNNMKKGDPLPWMKTQEEVDNAKKDCLLLCWNRHRYICHNWLVTEDDPYKAASYAYVAEKKLKIGRCACCNTKVHIANTFMFEFDHMPGFTKEWSIFDMHSQGMPIDMIRYEMDKCQLLCKNCHVIVTLLRKRNKDVVLPPPPSVRYCC